MIVKHLTRKSNAGQLFTYIFRYVLNPEKQKANILNKANTTNEKPCIIRHNVRSKDIKGMMQEFKQNEANRVHKRSNGVTVNHTIISFGAQDAGNVTDTMLRDIAKEYIRLRSPNSLFCGTKHTDRNHKHIHLIGSSCAINGLSNRMSKQAFADLKVRLQAYQMEKYPQLVHSLPQHGRAKDKAKRPTLRKQEDKELKQMREIRRRSKEQERDRDCGRERTIGGRTERE